jgi:hypothetical protein
MYIPPGQISTLTKDLYAWQRIWDVVLKAVEATKQKEEKRKKPKPEEHEGMPHHQHCPPEKCRGDKNPECHEEQ